MRLPEKKEAKMSKGREAGAGFLANALTKPRWDSRIKSANTTKKEMWLGYVVGVWGMMMTSSIVNSYYNQYLTDVLGFTADKALWIPAFMVTFPVLSKLLDAVTNIVMSKIIDSTLRSGGMPLLSSRGHCISSPETARYWKNSTRL